MKIVIDNNVVVDVAAIEEAVGHVREDKYSAILIMRSGSSYEYTFAERWFESYCDAEKVAKWNESIVRNFGKNDNPRPVLTKIEAFPKVFRDFKEWLNRTERGDTK